MHRNDQYNALCPPQAGPVERVSLTRQSGVSAEGGIIPSIVGEQCIGVGPARICINLPFAGDDAV
jgi:hypothetical protein